MNWQFHMYILISNLGVTFGDKEREATEKNLFGVWQKWGQIDKKFHAEFPSIFLNAVSCDKNLRMKAGWLQFLSGVSRISELESRLISTGFIMKRGSL